MVLTGSLLLGGVGSILIERRQKAELERALGEAMARCAVGTERSSVLGYLSNKALPHSVDGPVVQARIQGNPNLIGLRRDFVLLVTFNRSDKVESCRVHREFTGP